MIPNICIHYDDRYWKNPQEFNPDRFTPEETASRPNLAFMPFGEGPRNCIGMRLKLLAFFKQILLKFHLDLHKSTSSLQLQQLSATLRLFSTPAKLNCRWSLNPATLVWLQKGDFGSNLRKFNQQQLNKRFFF